MSFDQGGSLSADSELFDCGASSKMYGYCGVWLLVSSVLSGLLGTAAMDLGNAALTLVGFGYEVSYESIGALTRGWLAGNFLYAKPSDVVSVSSDYALGAVSHYIIGVIFAMPAAFLCLRSNSANILLVVAYGLGTSVISLGLLFPSIGLGLFASKTSNPLFFVLTNLYNHLFYGLGLAVMLGFLVRAPAGEAYADRS